MCDSKWFAQIRAALIKAGVQPADLTFMNQGYQHSIELDMKTGNMLIRGVEDVEGRHAGLAESCETVRSGLEQCVPNVRQVSCISTTAADSLLRYVHVLDLAGDPESAKHLPCLTLRRRVTTSESRGTAIDSARESPHKPQSTAAWLDSAAANLFHILKQATLRLPFLQRSGQPPPRPATRFLVCSYTPKDVVGYKNS